MLFHSSGHTSYADGSLLTQAGKDSPLGDLGSDVPYGPSLRSKTCLTIPMRRVYP